MVQGPRHTSYPIEPFWENIDLHIANWEQALERNKQEFKSKEVSV